MRMPLRRKQRPWRRAYEAVKARVLAAWERVRPRKRSRLAALKPW